MNLLEPVGKQADSILDSTARINLWHGSVRSSKTIMSLIRWCEFVADAIANDRPGKLLMFGKTERTLKRNVLDPLAEMVGKDLKISTGSGEARLFGRTIDLAGANDERAWQKIAGMTLLGAYGDEVTLAPETFFKMLLSRLSVPGAKLFGTCNPDSPHHYIRKQYILRGNELDLASFHFTLDDNPSLDPDYVASLKAEYVPGSLWYMRYIDGLWVVAEGAIYDCWGDDVFAEAPKREDVLAYWLAIDYGTASVFEALLLAETEDRIVAVDEWRWDAVAKRRQLTDAEYSKELGQWLADRDANGHRGGTVPIRPVRWFTDPSASSFIRQAYQDGHPVTPADNTVDDGIRVTFTLLKSKRLQIVKDRCPGLEEEMPGYVWDPKAQEQGIDQPLKQADHGPDALRYGAMGLKRVWRKWVHIPLKETS